MIINNSHGFVFVHIPKNAGTSIARYYSQLSGINDVEIGGTDMGEALLPIFVERHRVGKHAPYRKIRGLLESNPLPRSYFSFAFTRNPYERTLSTFLFLKQWLPGSHAERAKSAFEEILDVNDMIHSSFWQESDIDNMFKPQVFWVTDERQESLIVDFCGRVENLREDISRLNKKLNVNLPEFEIRLNITERGSAVSGYNRDSIEIMKERYKSDFDFFSYDLQPPIYLVE
jgi:hypothetical protein